MPSLHRLRWIACIALSVFLTTALVSCSDDEEASDDSPSSLTADGQTVVSSAATDSVETVATEGPATMITADDDTAPGGGDVDSWDAIAVQSPDGTDLAIVDATGEHLDRFDLEDGGSMVSSGPYVMMDPTDPDVIDTRSGDRMSIEIDDGAFARFLAPPSPIVAVYSTEGANVRLFDPNSGIETDVAAIGDLTDPVIVLQAGAPFDAEAGVLGLFDHSTSQSLLVEVDGDDEPVFLQGRVVDVAFGSALAVRPARQRIELRFHDLEGKELATVDVPELRAAWLTDNTTARVVTASGDLLRLTAEGDRPDQLATLDMDETDPRPNVVLRQPQRLAYETLDGRVAIVNWEGTEIAEVPGELAVTHTVNRMTQRCVAVRAEQDDDAQLSQTRLLDTESGEPVGQAFELDNFVLSTSDDGCTVSTMEGQAPVVIHRNRATELESGRLALVSPDGESVIVSSGLQNVLQSAGDEGDDPVDLPDGDAVFIDRS